MTVTDESRKMFSKSIITYHSININALDWHDYNVTKLFDEYEKKPNA